MRYICEICGFICDDVKERISFTELPDTWKCPDCGAAKSSFMPKEDTDSGLYQMKISQKGSKSFYREIIHVTLQYHKLLRKPQAKLLNSFGAWKRYIIGSLILLAVSFAEMSLLGPSTLIWMMISVLLLLEISSITALFVYNRQLNEMLRDDEEAELTLDNEGIGLSKASITVKLSWENIAFARIFSESICFIPKKQTGMVIGISRRYYDDISPYIKCRVYGDDLNPPKR